MDTTTQILLCLLLPLLGTCLVERQSVRRLEPAEPETVAES